MFDLSPTDLAFLAIVAGFFYLVIRQISENWRTRVKAEIVKLRKQNKSLGIGTQLITVLDNAPAILARTRGQIDDAKKRGATDEMLKPLHDQVSQIHLLQRFEMPVRALSPMLDMVGDKSVERFGKFIERLFS